MTKKAPFANAMAFYHGDGLVSAWKQANKFSGDGGRIATLPDIINARIESDPNTDIWNKYYTTNTAEYFGISRSGKHILIVAHGIGPMSTLDGVQKAYSWEYKDKTRSRRGGRITEQEFWDLEDGKYGEVKIIDLDSYVKLYEYPFMQPLRFSEALVDPVLNARFGPRAEEYLKKHAYFARRCHKERARLNLDRSYYNISGNEDRPNRGDGQHIFDGANNSDPYIVSIEDASNNCYWFGIKEKYRAIEAGYAVCHLISIGQVVTSLHSKGEIFTFDVGCHEWWDGVRMIGIKAGEDIGSHLNKGPDSYRLLRKHWRDLLQPMSTREEVVFRALVQIDDQWFTQYPKVGDGMDTHEPEYVVTSIQSIGDPVLFRTEVLGYHGFFKFATSGVKALAPQGANAYRFVSEPVNIANATYQTCMVQFYRIEADTSRRLRRAEELSRDYEILMTLLEKKAVSV